MVGDFSTFKDAIVNNICNIFCNECGVNVARELGNKNQDELIFEANLKKNPVTQKSNSICLHNIKTCAKHSKTLPFLYNFLSLEVRNC